MGQDPRIPWGRAMLLGLVMTGCGGPADVAIVFERVDDGFRFSEAEAPGREPFDALCADMDLDGDDDLLVNWHHLAPLELFENRNGSFVPMGHRAGLDENPDLPTLFADNDTMLRGLTTASAPGLYLWHGLPRDGDGWRFAWNGREPRRLLIRSNTPVIEVIGLPAGEYRTLADGQTLQVTLPAADRVFGIQAEKVATRLRVELEPGTEPIRIGPRLQEVRSGQVVLWKPDPHGMAWVDVEADPRPELFVARGAMMGTLAPPEEPKRDRYFVPDESALSFNARFGDVPPDYGRGRRVEWIDVDLDGEPELSLGNKRSPNRMLDRAVAPGPFADIAADLGLDLDEADVHAWGDFDGDGRDDLYFIAAGRLHVLRNGTNGFVSLPQAEIELNPGDGERIISVAALRLADFDNDGRLDVWLLSLGTQRTHRLLLRRDTGFEDVTERVGLGGLAGATVTLLADWDGDAFVDAVSFGPAASGAEAAGPVVTLWRNRAGRRFEIVSLDVGGSDVPADEIRAAAICDVDGDGRTDIVAIGDRRHVLRNVTEGGGVRVAIALPAGRPSSIGTIVRAVYADGSVNAQRFGSASSSAYGQSLRDLRVARPNHNRLERLLVRWPGDAEDKAYPIVPGGGRWVIERGAGVVP